LLREDGKVRLLQVPPVRDRVVERTVLAELTPIVDPLLGPWCFGYRPGLGVADAVQALVGLREEGLGWVARADVADCFPSIPVPHLRRLITAVLDPGPLRDLVDQFLGRASTGPGGLRPALGLPQGSPLSPLWSNLVLTRLDERLADAGFPTVRYGDDLAAAAGSREQAWEAMRVASGAVEELGMRLGAGKSDVMSFGGFHLPGGRLRATLPARGGWTPGGRACAAGSVCRGTGFAGPFGRRPAGGGVRRG
jgi:CRISPR-associated protein Cas1